MMVLRLLNNKDHVMLSHLFLQGFNVTTYIKLLDTVAKLWFKRDDHSQKPLNNESDILAGRLDTGSSKWPMNIYSKIGFHNQRMACWEFSQSCHPQHMTLDPLDNYIWGTIEKETNLSIPLSPWRLSWSMWWLT